ncbi:hypothetical protein [Sphingomonas rubra]|uniref:Uncharacterized protein n=1 Tax=Sphingomonas rubra TaxID=634430 RepID=A0A1I5RNN8_9SPHN|nr:hypothetical protein [Sphingomonas rubra]SFP60103.1 hypothetical protein SAMN04488241_10410 [Sphingomonas rubra]
MDEVDVIVVGRGTSAGWQITSPGMMEAASNATRVPLWERRRTR